MDDESGESMELMEEVPLKELGEAELEISAWLTEESRGQRRGKHTETDLLFVEEMMWIDERV